MSGFGFDPEVAGGFQDADFETRELADAANRDERLRITGKCPHGWRQGQADGRYRCLDCGIIFVDERMRFAEKATR